MAASEPTASLGYLIHEVGRLMRRRFEEEARTHGITLPQWRALGQIAKNDCLTQKAIAELTDTDPMTVSGILDRLEKRGLIERIVDPSDSRAKLARLTPAGLELFTTAREVGLRMYEGALEGISQKDRKIVEDALARMRDNLAVEPVEFENERSR
jgi:DNA-binding MarR family transcriptional regulator